MALLFAVLVGFTHPPFVTAAPPQEAPRDQRSDLRRGPMADPQAAAQAMATQIDLRINQQLSARGLAPAALCDDADFLRRARLDLTGVVPTVAEARAFLVESTAPESHAATSFRRAQQVDRLLASPQHPTHLATVWRRILLPDDLELSQRQQTLSLQVWLRKQFAKNLRYDRFVAAFLSAANDDGAGPEVFYQAHELKPEKLAAATSRIFLGLQIQCAECHDHPFDDWTQRDFWGYAAFFAQLQNNDAQLGQTLNLVDLDRGDVTIPDTEEVVAPKFPTDSRATTLHRGTRRRQLAIWMASRDNPYLPIAAVNRVWAQMFGRGLVEPVDDLGPHNPASHPELMDELTQFLVEQQFDLRQLYRAIAYSETYQRTSSVPPSDHDPKQASAVAEPVWFERMAVRRLSAEQLFDSLMCSLSIDVDASPARDLARIQFVTAMRSNAASPVKYDLGVQQALSMMNGPVTSLATATDSAFADRDVPQETPTSPLRLLEAGLLTSLEAPFWSDQQRVETLFFATLSRMPTDGELNRLLPHADTAQDRANLLWALLNSAEYQFVR